MNDDRNIRGLDDKIGKINNASLNIRIKRCIFVIIIMIILVVFVYIPTKNIWFLFYILLIFIPLAILMLYEKRWK